MTAEHDALADKQAYGIATEVMAGWPVPTISMYAALVATARYALNAQPIRTHWEGCESHHPYCMVAKLIAALPALLDQLEAAERDAAIGRAIQRGAAELPDGWEVEITVERGAASVYLRDDDGETKAIDVDAGYRLPAEINAAIDAAREGK